MQITLCMLKFFFDRDQFMPAADTDAKQPSSAFDHFHCIFVASCLTHPCDRIECVIKEVRIDLCLKCFQLRLAQCDLLLPYLFHQLLDTHCHMFKGIGQCRDFFCSAHRLIDKPTAVPFEISHRFYKALDRFGKQI